MYNGFLWAITQKLAGSVPSPSVGVLPCYSSVCPRNVPFSHPPSVWLDNFTRTARSSLLEVFQSGVDVVSATLGPENISNFGPRRAPPSGSGSAEEREQTAHRSPAKSSLLLRLLRQIVSVFAPSSSARVMSQTSCRRTLGAMCEIRQCVRPGGGGEELLAEPCVSAHCSQTAVTRRQGRLE